MAFARPLMLVALAYAALGLASMQLAIPPGYATPFFLPAGIALAGGLIAGTPALIGVFVGAFLLSVLQMAGAGPFPSVTGAGQAWLAPVLALAALAQAGFGALLVRRWVGYPDPIDTPRSIARFMLLAAPVSSLLGAALVTAALSLADVVAPGEAVITLATVWVGETLGVAVAAPITLALFASPRADWDSRRVAIVAPLLIALLVVGVAIRQLGNHETERLQNVFEREAQLTMTASADRINSHLSVLDATHAFISAARTIDIERFAVFAQHWFPRFGGISAIGMSTRVQDNERDTFEAMIRGQSTYDFQILTRNSAGVLSPAVRADEHFAITYIEPRIANRRALGLDQLSVPQARDAIERSLKSGGTAATEPFQLTQEPRESLGLVFYRPFFRNGPDPVRLLHDRRYVAGVSFVTMYPERIMRGLDSGALERIDFCLSDVTTRAAIRLAGPPGCELAVPMGRIASRALMPVADRHWRLTLTPKPGFDTVNRSWTAWGIAMTALSSLGMLAAFLLAVSGRARRTEALVAERTLELRREIAERRSALSALTESEQRLRDMFDTAPVGISYTALDGRLQRINPRFAQITGCEAADVRGLKIVDLLHRDDRDAFVVGLLRLIGDGSGIFRQEARCMREDGTTVHVEILVSLHRDADGEPRQAVVAMQDISTRLELVAAQHAREAAEAASSAKTQFLSRISHELRTPLNALLGFAQLLRLDSAQRLAPRQDEHVRHIEQAGWHLLNMINDVLDLSRIESGSVRIELQDIDLQPVFEECQRLLREHYTRCKVTLGIQLDERARYVRGDPTRMRQVLTNLLDNAAKYNRPNGHVVLSTRPSETGDVVISVRDEGMGLNRKQREHLFEPFNRLGREHLMAGTGIGLVITRHLVEMMGGNIDVASIEGRGSIFAITLARAHAPVPEGAPAGPPPLPDSTGLVAASPSRAAMPAGPGQPPPIIVYVEDNRLNAMLVRDMIAQHTPYRVEIFEDAEEALTQIARLRPAMILMDLNLPGMDGLQALARLRMDEATAHIPVVIVSADAMPERIEQATELGADGYLTKPLRLNELQALLAQVLGDGPYRQPATALDPLPETSAPRGERRESSAVSASAVAERLKGDARPVRPADIPPR